MTPIDTPQSQTNYLKRCQRVRTLSAYSFMLFLPISIAFAQMSLTLLGLTFIAEALITRQFRWPRTPLDRPLLAYLAATGIATIFSLRPLKSVQGLESLLLLLTFYVVYEYIQTSQHLETLLRWLIFSISVAALYGVIQHFLEVDLFRLSRPISFLKHINDDLAAPVRVPGFLSYMTFSEQLAMMIPIISAGLLARKTRRQRIPLALSLALTSVALLWTYTRSSWLGAICTIVLLGSMRNKKFLLICMSLLLVALLLAYVFQPELIERIVSIFRAEDNIERVYTWESTLRMIRDHPLTGIGEGNYSHFVDQYRTRYGDFEFTSRAHAHNNILQVTVEGGLLALICFLWLWGVIFRELYQTYQRVPENQGTLKLLSLGCFCAMIAFFIQGFFEHSFGDSETMMLLWTLLAMALKVGHFAKIKKRSVLRRKV